MKGKRVGKITVAAAAALLVAAAAALGQQPGGMQTPGQPGAAPQPMPNAGTADTAGTGNEQGSLEKMADQDFVRSTLEDDDAAVQMSQLAAQKSPSQDVKQFGEQMVKTHTALNDQLAPWAKQLGVSAPKGPSKKEKKELEKLQALSGPGFDAEYLRMIGREQQHDLKSFKDELSSPDANAKQMAKMDVPVLSQNLQVLRQIAEAHNVPLGSQGK